MGKPDLAEARAMDAGDTLASFRQRFVVDDPQLIYLLGNSLGRLPSTTVERLQQTVEEEWGARLIRGWSEGWMEMSQRIGDKIGRLLGAQPGEVLLADATSVNLYKVVMAALSLRSGRHKIVTDTLNFPSDLYIMQGAVQNTGDKHVVEIVSSEDGVHGPLDGLRQAIDQGTALVALSHTVFKSAYVYDMADVTRMAHDAGALVVWDLSHSAGSVQVDLNEAQADFAVGCTYKYLNGGPGAPAFLYARRDLQEEARNPISGWMGQDRPFDFQLQYRPAPNLRRFLSGTPPILSLAALEPGVDLLLEAGMEQIREKSIRQTEYLIALWDTYLQPLDFALRSPRAARRRGSHVALSHPQALGISLALKEQMNLLLDFRHPDNLRLSVAPLYTPYEAIYEAVQRIRKVVSEGLYEAYSAETPAVT